MADWYLELGDFDADGDGELDVLFSPFIGLGVVRYGPFSGPISPYADGFDPENTSLFGSDDVCGDNPQQSHGQLTIWYGKDILAAYQAALTEPD